jgi:hypothetical protein
MPQSLHCSGKSQVILEVVGCSCGMGKRGTYQELVLLLLLPLFLFFLIVFFSNKKLYMIIVENLRSKEL